MKPGGCRHILASATPQRLGSVRKGGQSTIEYLIVGLAFICIIGALGLLAGRLQQGLFVQHAAESASHSLTVNSAGSAGDILLY